MRSPVTLGLQTSFALSVIKTLLTAVLQVLQSRLLGTKFRRTPCHFNWNIFIFKVNDPRNSSPARIAMKDFVVSRLWFRRRPETQSHQLLSQRVQRFHLKYVFILFIQIIAVHLKSPTD